MSALTDLVRGFEEVDLGGTAITVYGLDGEQIGKLFMRFPKVRTLINDLRKIVRSGSEDEADEVEETAAVDPKALAQLGGKVIGAAIAYAVGDDDDEKAEAVAAKLPAGYQLRILSAAWRLTFPNGLREAEAVLKQAPGQDSEG